MNVKITERDIYNMMIDGTIDAETMRSFAEKKIAQLDKRNATARLRAEKKKAEADVLKEQILSVLSEDPMSREDVVYALQDEGIETTIGKVGYRLTAMSKPEDGRVLKQEAVIPGSEGKKAKTIMVYSLAQ